MRGSLKRVEQRAVSAQNMANDIENRTRIDVTGNRLRLTDGERLYPKSWLGSTYFAGFPRVDPKHEAGKWIQQVTKGTLRATAAWTDGRRDVDMLNWTTSWQWHWPA